jgi:drug/metabolite transporter (DMT)-like permease
VSNGALFAIATGIWGSTWLAITFQLGPVPAEPSVAYRFLLAALLLFAGCRVAGVATRPRLRDHPWVAAQGVTMFGVNYVAIYWAEERVSSGLVAVVFSTIVFMAPVGMRLAFGERLSPRMAGAAALGVAGVALLFLPELRAAAQGGDAARGIAFALFGTLVATVGNLFAVRNHRRGVGLFPSTAWGMAYGALSAAVMGVLGGAAWTVEAAPGYLLSLAYLAVFGSIFAFLAYLTLLHRVGAGPTAYVGVSTPVVAMLLSTVFEGYRWSAWAVAGVALAVVGNLLALRSRPR